MKKISIMLFAAILLMGCSNNDKKILSLEEAQKIALEEVQGKVVKAKEEIDDGRSYYDFTTVSDTGKCEIEIDSTTGKNY